MQFFRHQLFVQAAFCENYALCVWCMVCGTYVCLYVCVVYVVCAHLYIMFSVWYLWCVCIYVCLYYVRYVNVMCRCVCMYILCMMCGTCACICMCVYYVWYIW